MTEKDKTILLCAIEETIKMHELAAKMLERVAYHLEKGENQEAKLILHSIQPRWRRHYEKTFKKFSEAFPDLFHWFINPTQHFERFTSQN